MDELVLYRHLNKVVALFAQSADGREDTDQGVGHALVFLSPQAGDQVG